MSTSRVASNLTALLLCSAIVLTACASAENSEGAADHARPPQVETSEDSTTANGNGRTVQANEKVWPRWDPRDVDQLPAASDEIATALPSTIEPPESSPLLADQPTGSAVVAVERAGVAQLRSPEGAWRRVPLDGRNHRIQLSPRGTRLAVSYYSDQEYWLTIHDVRTGSAQTLSSPKPPSEGNSWFFLNERKLLIGGGRSAYVVAVDRGTVQKQPYRFGLSQTVDPSGNVLVSAQWAEPNVLTDYRAATPREVSMRLTGRLSSIRAGGNRVVGTSYDKRPFALIVADRKTLTPQTSLPLLDFQGNYSNWGLSTLALDDEGCVLLRVAVIGKGKSGFRVVAWNPSSGRLSIVSSTDLPVAAQVVFAEGLLRRVG